MAAYYPQTVTIPAATLSQRDTIHLSPRQIEVLQLLGEGMSNKLIARALGISDGTVKQHIKCVLDELGAQSRLQAVIFAYRRGLLPIETESGFHAPVRLGVAIGGGLGSVAA